LCRGVLCCVELCCVVLLGCVMLCVCCVVVSCVVIFVPSLSETTQSVAAQVGGWILSPSFLPCTGAVALLSPMPVLFLFVFLRCLFVISSHRTPFFSSSTACLSWSLLHLFWSLYVYHSRWSVADHTLLIHFRSISPPWANVFLLLFPAQFIVVQ